MGSFYPATLLPTAEGSAECGDGGGQGRPGWPEEEVLAGNLLFTVPFKNKIKRGRQQPAPCPWTSPSTSKSAPQGLLPWDPHLRGPPPPLRTPGIPDGMDTRELFRRPGTCSVVSL